MTRRRLLRAAAATAGVAVAWAALTSRRANAYYQGPASDHFDGYQFFNPGREEPKGAVDFLRWHVFEPATPWPSRYPSAFADRPPPVVNGAAARICCIGHATFLVQTGGHNILIDPVWGKRASPFRHMGPRRVNPPGVALADLPAIDTLLITHNHYDHMDLETVGRLWRRHRPRIVTPLGNDVILRQAIPGLVAEAYDWDAAIRLSDRVTVHVEPTQHWSARGTLDRRHALWASFVIETPAGKIYSVGDSGFGDGHLFARVAKRHPGLRLALLPIGAYEPRWFMSGQHMNPDEAVQAFLLSGAREALGHHWGTFQLTNEGIEAPLRDLDAALARHGIAADRFRPVRPGEVGTVA